MQIIHPAPWWARPYRPGSYIQHSASICPKRSITTAVDHEMGIVDNNIRFVEAFDLSIFDSPRSSRYVSNTRTTFSAAGFAADDIYWSAINDTTPITYALWHSSAECFFVGCCCRRTRSPRIQRKHVNTAWYGHGQPPPVNQKESRAKRVRTYLWFYTTHARSAVPPNTYSYVVRVSYDIFQRGSTIQKEQRWIVRAFTRSRCAYAATQSSTVVRSTGHLSTYQVSIYCLSMCIQQYTYRYERVPTCCYSEDEIRRNIRNPMRFTYSYLQQLTDSSNNSSVLVS